MASSARPAPRGRSTLCLPVSKDRYEQVVGDAPEFRRWLDQAFGEAPELFPKAFAHGYRLKDSRPSARLGVRLRRVECHAGGAAFTVRPSFVLPYMAALTHEAEKALYLRKFGVPFHALAYVFGRDPMYWYRLEVSLGRNSIVGTTVRQASLPEHLLTDEHHQTLDGEKVYVVFIEDASAPPKLLEARVESLISDVNGIAFRLDTRKPLATLGRTALHGRPTPPSPPRGPISRVSSSLGMRRPAPSTGSPCRSSCAFRLTVQSSWMGGQLNLTSIATEQGRNRGTAGDPGKPSTLQGDLVHGQAVCTAGPVPAQINAKD